MQQVSAPGGHLPRFTSGVCAMFRKLVCAAFVMTIGIGFVAADEFGAIISKVDGDKITFKKGKKGSEDTTLPAAKDLKVAKGKKGDDKKYTPGDAVEGGLKNEIFTKIGDKGLAVRITTDADNKTITQ